MSCKNILIVEDDHAIRQMMKDVLELNGYKIHTASDGSEGIQVLQKILPQPCLVLLDLMMPGTNGWQFLDVQRSDPSFASIPVVVCSAYKESAKAVAPSAIVEKPIQLEALLGAVKAFCA